MMRKALVASIGMAAMLALAACSGNDVDKAEHDRVLAGNEDLGEDLEGVREELKTTKEAEATTLADRQEAEEKARIAVLSADIAQRNYEKAQRDFDNGDLDLTALENARDEALRAKKAAEDARDEALRTQRTEEANRDRYRRTSSRDLPQSHTGVNAQTVTIEPGESMTLGNVAFECDAASPDECEIEVTADGRFISNILFVTARLVTDSPTDRLFSGTIGTVGADDVAVVFFPGTQTAGGDANNVSVYIREDGVSTTTDYKVTATSHGDPFGFNDVATADRAKNLWRLYAGAGDGSDGHDGPPDFKIDAAPTTAGGWSIASLDGLTGVKATTYDEDELWTKSWMVDGADLGSGRSISLDVYTDIEETGTTAAVSIASGQTAVAAAVNEAFSNAVDQAAVAGALSSDGYQLVSEGGVIGTAPAGTNADRIHPRLAYQLEIDAVADQAGGNIDEGKRVRVSDLPDGSSTTPNHYQLAALTTTTVGTPAWFYGIPGRVVCGGSPVDCGNEIIANPAVGANTETPGSFAYRGSAAGANGGLKFRAAAGSHRFYKPDADWVSIGVWSVEPASGGTEADVQMGAFVHGSMPWDYSDADISYTDTPSAKYEGGAVGRYAQRVGGNEGVGGDVGFGKFAATVNLTFALGASADAGRLSGSITGFRLDGAADTENWRIRLPATHSHRLLYDATPSSGACGLNLGTTGSCRAQAELDGLADGFAMTGRMNARAFGPSATADANQTPTTIAGTFFAEQDAAIGDHYELSLIGAFLAGREEPAGTE